MIAKTKHRKTHRPTGRNRRHTLRRKKQRGGLTDAERQAELTRVCTTRRWMAVCEAKNAALEAKVVELETCKGELETCKGELETCKGVMPLPCACSADQKKEAEIDQIATYALSMGKWNSKQQLLNFIGDIKAIVMMPGPAPP
jgi:hypothetical protein